MNKMACHLLEDDAYIMPDDMLPVYEFFFEEIGNENIRGQDCVKFYSEDNDGDSKAKHYLWAVYNNSTETWQPVRYESIKTNVWHGYIDTHDIWDFDNFDTDFNTDDAFALPEACNDTIEHNIHDEAVTKDLLFMDHHKNKHVDHVFNAFKAKFGKDYADIQEHAMRKNLFQKRMRLIRETNCKNLSYKLAVNHLADRTPEELKKYRGLKRRDPGDKGTHPFPYTQKTLKNVLSDLPDEYDTRSEGLVAPVQNQGDCGSCWTYGTTAAAEGALARKEGKLIRLSNQALIDCGWEFGNDGCDGGADTTAYKWMMKYGLPTIADYGTYEQVDDYCRISNISEDKLHPIRGFVDVTPNSVGALKVALYQNGPLSVSIDATDRFLSYSSGIFYDTECLSNSTSLNHEITLVGYGEQYGETFWIVKNSYGPNWGISGYMHILAKDNNCGIMTEPTYVLF
ncbi:digestive cysteine proteinase 1-like isoform X2 [Hyposmocoma kahamanoa]|nr:digestive cysteine proteinase 1-like isoform X2 [Hyposmocoma kahamanoa]